jgi:hypothetical protein
MAKKGGFLFPLQQPHSLGLAQDQHRDGSEVLPGCNERRNHSTHQNQACRDLSVQDQGVVS